MATPLFSLPLDLDWCPLCDGLTTQTECDECGESHCNICLSAYGCEGCE